MILDGIKAYNALKNKLHSKIKYYNIKPNIKAIYIGNNPASEKYLKNKKKKLDELNINFEVIHLPKPEINLIFSLIDELNKDKKINGIIVQLPLPNYLKNETQNILDLITPIKDVDCLNTINQGKLFTSNSLIIPATPQGIISLLKFYKIKVSGKNITIVGRSNLVGKPLAISLLNRNATVTVCHSKTKNIQKITQKADMVILATGNPLFFTKDYFNKKQTIIDVGINITPNGKLVGDVDFDSIKDFVKNITPVPGGIGPMTIYGLAKNLIKLTILQKSL